MKRLFIIFVMFILSCPRIGYASASIKNTFHSFFDIPKKVAYIELQSGTTGEFVYIVDQKQMKTIQNFLETMEYDESSIEEYRNDKAVGGFQYVITFYCEDGTGYRFNKIKEFITTGSFTDMQNVMILHDDSDKEFREFFQSTYESIDKSYEVSIPAINMLHKVVDVKPSNHQLKLIDLYGTNIIENVPSYIYSDYNYFKLRDIGEILGYDVKWDPWKNEAVFIKSEQAKAITNLQAQKEDNKAFISSQTIRVKGEEKDSIFYCQGCINIDGYQYFKLRELETILNFEYNWDTKSNTITIYTN